MREREEAGGVQTGLWHAAEVSRKYNEGFNGIYKANVVLPGPRQS